MTETEAEPETILVYPQKRRKGKWVMMMAIMQEACDNYVVMNPEVKHA